MRTRSLLLIIFLFLGNLHLVGGNIVDIRFEGLKKTNKKWLSAQLKCKIGQNFDNNVLQADEQYIKDLNLFFEVWTTINTISEDDVEIIFHIKESLYFYPIINWKKAKDNYKIQLGGSYDHFLGMKGKIGGIIEYYDRLSFVFYHDLPLHLNQKTGHFFGFSLRQTVEPVNFGESKHTIDFTSYTIGGGLYYHWKPRWVSSLGVQYFKESYYTEYKDDPIYNDGESLDFNKIQFNKGFKIDGRHFNEELVSGYLFEVNLEYIKTFEFSGTDGDFFKVNSSIRLFKKIRDKKDNLALRIHFGLSSNGNIPLPPFVIDNFINVRGVGDRQVRGTGLLGFNLEYRMAILTHDYFFLQAIVFSDFSSIRPRLEMVKSLFDAENISMGNGLGLRFQLRKFYHSVLSIDYSIPALNKGGSGGLIFGIGQYF